MALYRLELSKRQIKYRIACRGESRENRDRSYEKHLGERENDNSGKRSGAASRPMDGDRTGMSKQRANSNRMVQ